MVIADLHSETPVVAVKAGLQIRVQGIRDAGGPASGEPVEIRMTKDEAKWLVKRLQEVIEEL